MRNKILRISYYRINIVLNIINLIKICKIKLFSSKEKNTIKI